MRRTAVLNGVSPRTGWRNEIVDDDFTPSEFSDNVTGRGDFPVDDQRWPDGYRPPISNLWTSSRAVAPGWAAWPYGQPRRDAADHTATRRSLATGARTDVLAQRNGSSLTSHREGGAVGIRSA